VTVPGKCSAISDNDRQIFPMYTFDGHNLQSKGIEFGVWCLGGIFLVVPSGSNFSIETIRCQTKLMGEYDRGYVLLFQDG
jgi:hypothetical protein